MYCGACDVIAYLFCGELSLANCCILITSATFRVLHFSCVNAKMKYCMVDLGLQKLTVH